MIKKKLQIFISSTYTDLKEERQAAVSAILKAGHIPAGMELFTSGDESQMGTIKRWIDESDVFMLILGGRYGSVEPTTSLSYTELEYDYAVSTGKPYFAVVIDEAALDQKVRQMGREVIESTYTRELALFREKVLSKISAFFSDARDIRLAVHETISDFIIRYDFKGWISGNEVPDTQGLFEQIKKQADEIKHLAEENRRLAEDNETLRRQLALNENKAEDSLSFEALLETLREIEIRTTVFNEENDVNEYTYSLYWLLKFFGERMIIGINNRMDMSDTDKFLFFNVLPKLQIYGLAISESVPNVAWRRFALSPKGISLLAYMQRKDSEAKKESEDNK